MGFVNTRGMRWAFRGAFLAFMCTAVYAQRVPRVISPDKRIARRDSVHPLTKSLRSTGRVAADLRLDRMLLVMNPTEEQQKDLDSLVERQHDPLSPEYGQWLSPEEFATRFSPSPQDLAAVARWLESAGFEVAEIARGGRLIEFSGTALQLERAFGTQMRHYDRDGVRHLANSTEIMLPAELDGIVGGIASLNDFFSLPLHHTETRPLTNLSGGAHALSPGDFATIYNLGPLWSAGVDGTGQTVAVVGRSNFLLTDVTSFRSMFGLPVNSPQVILNGPSPGIISQGEEVEALLDVQWAGAVAKNATIKFVLSASTNATGGDMLSSQYIVNNNVAPILSSSFGLCEAQLGSANTFFNSLWQQAAAQGISVIVAAGDSGSAGCDYGSTTHPATSGLAVSGIASTPWNLAVGGTQFNEAGADAAYWNASNNPATFYATAKAWIPEVVWNESSAAGGLWAGSGGVSSLYATPSWQTGTGVPTTDPGASGRHRYMPDVSLSGASHDPYLVMLNGGLIGVGGTSAAAPAFAGIMALRNQKLNSRAGNPAAALYSMAGQFPTAFHDVVSGTNAVPCMPGSLHCSGGLLTGFAAGPGYDLASGLGSVNAYNLVMNWPAATVAAVGPVVTTLSPSTLSTSSSNQNLTLTGTGFKAGAKVNVAKVGGTTAVLTPTAVSATSIVVPVNVGLFPATFAVQVVHADGTKSVAVHLTVSAPAPSVTSVSPASITGSTANQTITLAGANFQTGAKVNLTYSGGTSSSLTPASVSATSMAVPVNVGTTVRTWTLQVVTPDGKRSATSSLAVTAPPPLISSLSPASLVGSAVSQNVTLNGSGFQSGAKVSVSYSGGAVSTLVPTTLVPTTLTATIIKVAVNFGTTPRTWTVKVTNPDGKSSGTANLAVTAPAAVAAPAPAVSAVSTSSAPTVTAVNPNTLARSGATQAVTITGIGFKAGLKIVLSGAGTATTIQGTAITSIAATKVVARINPGNVARVFSLQLVNSDGKASNLGSLTIE